ncbi:MAG TPA: diguanylate cyclase [Solirubrobacteraceae bacterium]|nr:diguanylate cyclase [Solirubrobacteraceae bacterium]
MLTAGVRGKIGPALERFIERGLVASEERPLAGSVSGAFFVVGGVTLIPLIVVPGTPHGHRLVMLVLTFAACAWGAASLLLIDWERAPRYLIHFSVILAIGLIGTAVASSGGATSPAWVYLFFVVVFAAYFFAWPVASLYLALSIATVALPLVYDGRATHDEFLGELVIAGPAYVVLGGAILAGRQLMEQLRARAERLAAEQGSFRRVATAVVEGETPGEIFDLVAREAALLLRAGAAGILRFDSDSKATVMGAWSDREGGRYPPGTEVGVGPDSDAALARDSNGPIRVDDNPAGNAVRRLGYASSLVAPVRVGGKVWGILAATGADPGQLTDDDEQRLMEFGDLLATAIASIDDRARLAAQASTDALTGLANRRALHERLAAEVSRAVRHARVLSVAVIDIDHFKHVNDYGGHDTGDEMLVRVARCLADHARAEDVLGRVGGDEFAWVMPETNREQALVAVERARRLIAATASRQFRITVSAGLCDTNASTHSAQLVSFADSALYWSKAHGRNRCWIYDPEVIGELSAPERVQRLERSHAVLGLRELARAIDAKDPATREHSIRVAALVTKLARAAGWSPQRAVALSEAALVHDVGKVAISDDVLHKVTPLTGTERDEVREHAELAARIAEGVLDAEQVEWIRTHHERPDGSGYPRGLAAAEIPQGAALLAVADAWDVMTSGRPYCAPKGVDEALAECAQLVGSQFTREAVGALMKLHADGELDIADLGPARDATLPTVD